MNLTVIPLKSKYQKATFVLFDEITKIFFDNNVSLKNGDIIVISSKYVAGSQGRILETNSVVPSDRANLISKKFKIKSKFAEIILKLSDSHQTYCFVDIPPVLYIATEYLRSIFPDRIIDYSQAIEMGNIDEKDIKGKILVIPPWLLEKIDMKFDCL